MPQHKNQTSFQKGQLPWNTGIKLSKIPKYSHVGFQKGHKGIGNIFQEGHSDFAKNKGRKHNQGYREKCRKIHLGKKFSEETKRKMSEAHKGEKSSLWRGGKMKNYPLLRQIRESLEYRLWRKSVLERDNFTCMKTGIKGGNLQAHHINNFADFSELRTSIENGITLNKEVHKEFHKIYGRGNNTKEQLEEFLNNDKFSK